MAKFGSTGNGKPSTQGPGTALGANTVVGNVRNGHSVANGSTMPSGNKPSTGKGMRGTYLAAPGESGVYRQVGAGFGGSANTNPGTAKLPMTAATSANTKMKTGKGAGSKKGTHKGFL